MCQPGYKKKFGGLCEKCTDGGGPDFESLLGLFGLSLLLLSPFIYLLVKHRGRKGAGRKKRAQYAARRTEPSS